MNLRLQIKRFLIVQKLGVERLFPGNYFEYTKDQAQDHTKLAFGLPVSVPIFKLAYLVNGQPRYINVYPTVQFLYSHYIDPAYITEPVKALVDGFRDPASFYASFMQAVADTQEADAAAGIPPGLQSAATALEA